MKENGTDNSEPLLKKRRKTASQLGTPPAHVKVEDVYKVQIQTKYSYILCCSLFLFSYCNIRQAFDLPVKTLVGLSCQCTHTSRCAFLLILLLWNTTDHQTIACLFIL